MSRPSWTGDQYPYWKAENDEMYCQITLATQWLAAIWREDARSVTDDWDPSLDEREQVLFWRRFLFRQSGLTSG